MTFHVVGAHLVQALVGQGDDLVFPYAGLERGGDVLVGAVDQGGGGGQQRDLVTGLDLPGVQHHLLAVPDVHVLSLQLEEGGDFGPVHADRLVGHARAVEPVLDLGHLLVREPGGGRGGAAHGGVGGDAVLRLQPRAVHPVVHRGRAEVPENQLAGAGVQRVPAQLVPGPLADGDSGQVPDVVVVEDQQRAQPGILHGLSGAVQPVLPQAADVESLFEVDVHPAGRGGKGKCGYGHGSSCARPLLVRRARARCSYSALVAPTIQCRVQWDCQELRRAACSVRLHHVGWLRSGDGARPPAAPGPRGTAVVRARACAPDRVFGQPHLADRAGRLGTVGGRAVLAGHRAGQLAGPPVVRRGPATAGRGGRAGP